jgi:hypothetical protein
LQVIDLPVQKWGRELVDSAVITPGVAIRQRGAKIKLLKNEMIWIMEFNQFRCKPGRNHQEEQESAQQKKEALKGRPNHQKDEDRRKP